MAGNKGYKVDTAVIAAAGHGTRLLPLTLHQPKAMVSVGIAPLIHHVVEQIAAGGIARFIIVINPAFAAIKKYIAYQRERGEWRHLAFTIIEKRSKSIADSVLAAERLVRGQYFMVAACDDLLDDDIPPFLSFMKVFKSHNKPMVILRKVTRKEISNYGSVTATRLAKDVWNISDIIEKPSAGQAPSLLGAIADYILPPDIFHYIRLAQKQLPQDKEIAIVDALKFYLKSDGPLLGWVFNGRHFDGGSRIGLAKASIYFGSRHPEFGAAFKKYLKSL